MNTRTLIIAAFATVAFTLAVSGCKHVTSSQAPNTSVTGEIWYVKEITFPPGMVWATKVFYCPKPMGKGPANCIQATVHEEGEAPAPSGFGMPAQPAYGAPAQPAYGAPAQPGFGAPPQPGFGAPAQPGFGAPAQPTAPGGGYQPQPTPPPPPPPSY
jgi:hypothetical protein